MAAAPVGVTPDHPLVDADAHRNPYAGYGPPVSLDAFIGRAAACRNVQRRVFESVEAPSVAIVGPPRVGKSSLAKKVCTAFTGAPSPGGHVFVPVWITVGGLTSEQSLFRELANTVQNAVVDYGTTSARLEAQFDRLQATTGWDDMRMQLVSYFRLVQRLGHQVVAVLDEFDAARNIFTQAAPFELLRVLAYEPDLRVSLITTSRRDLTEIVVRSTAEISNFPQIFGVPVTLGCFDDSELVQLIARSPHTDHTFRTATHRWLSQETGGQPYVASALLCVLHELLPTTGDPAPPEFDRLFDSAIKACGALFVNYYQQLLELLRQEGRLQVLLEVLFGPQLTATPLDAERLHREGIIRLDEERWTAYSENFQEYLGLLERQVEDWPLWQKTETGLRGAVGDALVNAYGDDWVIRVEESQSRIVRNCEDRRIRAERSFGELAPEDNFLEYAYPNELLAIMMRHWDQITGYLGRTKTEWKECIELVARMRTPMAHNRRATTSPALMEEFRTGCLRLLGWVEQTRRSDPTTAAAVDQ